jgi:type VI secretion system protein VasJ
MEGLGKPYAAARRAMAAEVVRVVRSCPGLLEISFSDGTPMAGEPTRLWILHELSALPAKAGGAAGALETAQAEARKLVARKNFPEAAALLQKELRSAADRRDRFLGRLYLAKLCAEAGRLDLALPQLEGLARRGDRAGAVALPQGVGDPREGGGVLRPPLPSGFGCGAGDRW